MIAMSADWRMSSQTFSIIANVFADVCVLTNIPMHHRLRRHKTAASFKILQNRINESFIILLEIQHLNRHF